MSVISLGCSSNAARGAIGGAVAGVNSVTLRMHTTSCAERAHGSSFHILVGDSNPNGSTSYGGEQKVLIMKCEHRKRAHIQYVVVAFYFGLAGIDSISCFAVFPRGLFCQLSS